MSAADPFVDQIIAAHQKAVEATRQGYTSSLEHAIEAGDLLGPCLARRRPSSSSAAAIFLQACKLGLEGIVSKRLSAPYRSGPSRDWVKVKNPDSPAGSVRQD
jgi:hypothetical protein